MKIAIIHGQSHKGSTYHIARMLAEKLNGEITEFFLPKDFNSYCVGCTNCFVKSEALCPHYEQLKPITEAIDNADVNYWREKGWLGKVRPWKQFNWSKFHVKFTKRLQ